MQGQYQITSSLHQFRPLESQSDFSSPWLTELTSSGVDLSSRSQAECSYLPEPYPEHTKIADLCSLDPSSTYWEQDGEAEFCQTIWGLEQKWPSLQHNCDTQTNAQLEIVETDSTALLDLNDLEYQNEDAGSSNDSNGLQEVCYGMVCSVMANFSRWQL